VLSKKPVPVPLSSPHISRNNPHMKPSTNLTESAGDVNPVQLKVLFCLTLPSFCLKFPALPVCPSNKHTFKMKMGMEDW
jgi:hypothetical protein